VLTSLGLDWNSSAQELLSRIKK